MDMSEVRAQPQAEEGAGLRRAQLGRLTFGPSPASLMLAYADWLAHFLIAPDKHAPLGPAPGTYVASDKPLCQPQE